MPNIVNNGIFVEYTRTEEEQKLYDLEEKVRKQDETIKELKELITKTNNLSN